MSTNRAALLIAVAASSLPAWRATATGSTCTTSCTPGAVQCDSSGDVETCVQQGAVGSPGCTAAAELVYVVDVNNTFSSFSPGPPATFHDIGTLNCPDNNGGTPFSMSVDRSGTAWIIYSDGELFKVNTTTLACTATGYNNSTWSNFGMGFVSDTSGGSTDSLYIANVSPLELGVLNTATLGVSQLGNLTGSPELTGNSLAQLWGFFPDPSHPRVSQLDKTSGAEGTSFPMSALAGSPQDWAFAFYGGDFYVFLQRDTDSSTNVWHLSGTAGTVNELINDTGRSIVGAGESTCVPTETCYGWSTAPCPTGQACTAGACVATCTNACTAGATQCNAAGDVQTCAQQPSGCTGWSTAACPSGMICSAGACVPNCASRCTPPATQCSATGELDSCSLQANGCYDWSSAPCPSPQTCSGSACVTTCSNVCTAGATQCSSTGDVQTCAAQANGCTDWTSTACPTGQTCSSGACVPACTNRCTAGAVQCSGSTVQTCGPFSTGCTNWNDGANCGAAGCLNGACCPCVAGAIQCDASGNLQRCESSTTAQACPGWVTIPCTGGTCFDGACFVDCNPMQELSSCPSGSQCVLVPGAGSSDLCAIAESDGGYASPDPLPSSTASGTTAGSTGTVGGTSGGTTGGTNGGTSGSTGSHGATLGASGSTGATTLHLTSGGVGASGSATGHSGAAGSTGSTAGRGKGAGAVASTGCGCQSGGDLSMLALMLGAALAVRRRPRV